MQVRRSGAETKRFGRSAGLLSAGIGTAGLLTYVFFSLASHNLDATEYGEIVVLWSAVFVTISVAYRPVEQMLSRTIAERRARDLEVRSAMRIALAIQLAVSIGLGALALILRGPLEDDLLGGNETLYWVMVVAVVAFGASFYARGFFAGNRRFGLLTALLVCESGSRMAFALAVALGFGNGQATIALGVAVAPLVSLCVVPVYLSRRAAPEEPAAAVPVSPLSLAAGGGFAAAVLVVMLGEQVFLNAGPLLVRAFEDAAAAGFVFNMLMVARAPVLVFQGVAISLLPHLTRLGARGKGSAREFGASVALTLRAVAVFAAATVVVLAAVGPQLMQIAFGDRFEYDRLGLVIVGVGMGFYLAATTLSQAVLARGAAARGARCWAVAAAAFLVWCLLPVITDEARRVEVGFTLAAALLAALLAVAYRRSAGGAGMKPGSPDEIEARLAVADEAG